MQPEPYKAPEQQALRALYTVQGHKERPVAQERQEPYKVHPEAPVLQAQQELPEQQVQQELQVQPWALSEPQELKEKELQVQPRVLLEPQELQAQA